MIYPSDGIVLRRIKYGDTSMVATVYTSRFGMQTYLLKGVRGTGKNAKSHLYQPGSVLEMQVYHNPLKNLQYVKDARWKIVFQNTFTDIIKNAIAQLMVELLQKSILAEESNIALYTFAEDQLTLLDRANARQTANTAIKFMTTLLVHLGFGIHNNYSSTESFLDLMEGKFTRDDHNLQVESSPILNKSLSDILKATSVDDIPPPNSSTRRELLYLLEKYYQIHIDGFTECKSLKVIETVLHG